MTSSHLQSSFEFESADSLAQFSVWILPIAGGGILIELAREFLGWWAVLLVIAICASLVAGLRSSIAVCPGQVTVVRKWFFIPYKKYSAEFIEDISFGGDYGLEEGAMCVVVRMGGKEVHIGNSKNMHFLHETLCNTVRKKTS